MKLKDLTFKGGTVYINVVHKESTETVSLTAEKAIKKYGNYKVKKHIPYEPNDENVTEEEVEVNKNDKKRPQKEGTDIVILEG